MIKHGSVRISWNDVDWINETVKLCYEEMGIFFCSIGGKGREVETIQVKTFCFPVHRTTLLWNQNPPIFLSTQKASRLWFNSTVSDEFSVSLYTSTNSSKVICSTPSGLGAHSKFCWKRGLIFVMWSVQLFLIDSGSIFHKGLSVRAVGWEVQI